VEAGVGRQVFGELTVALKATAGPILRTRLCCCGHLDIKFFGSDDDLVRTTLTLDPDVAQRLQARMARRKTSWKQEVNEALRAGLAALGREEKKVRFVVEPHPCRFKVGIDLDKLNQLVDELEAEAALPSLLK
jgi:plasmid stability protein